MSYLIYSGIVTGSVPGLVFTLSKCDIVTSNLGHLWFTWIFNWGTTLLGLLTVIKLWDTSSFIFWPWDELQTTTWFIDSDQTGNGL